jgi:metal-sulfur cluster biosynthetic enzyme
LVLSEGRVREKLKEVMDPELGVNIVDLGLIYGVEVEGKKVKVKMTFTTPACPLLNFLVQNVEAKVREAGAKDVQVELIWDPPWSPEKMSAEAKRKLGIA